MDSRKKFSNRRERDEWIFQNALHALENRTTDSANSIYCAEKARTNTQAVDLILGFYDLDREDLEFLDNLDIIYRKLKLSGNWWKTSSDPLICRMENGEYTALIPGQFSGYYYIDANGKKQKVNADNQAQFVNVYNFCKKFPNEEITIHVYVNYIRQFISKYDIVLLFALCIISIIAGVLIPGATDYLLNALSQDTITARICIAMLVMIAASIFPQLASALTQILCKGITQKSLYSVRNAVLMRIFETDREIIGKKTGVQLMSVIYNLYELTESVVTLIPRIATMLLYILAYSVVMAFYVKGKALWIVLIFVLQAIVIYPIHKKYRWYFSESLSNQDKEQNVFAMMMEGLPKIQQMNAEKRSFAIWEKSFENYVVNDSSKNKFFHFNAIIPRLSVNLITLIIMAIAVFSHIEMTDFFVLIMIAGILVSNVSELINTTIIVTGCRAMWEKQKFFLQDNHYVRRKKTVGVYGDIRIENLTFAYADSVKILDNLNLKIDANDYVAIVGLSGSGKTTLLNLLMGVIFSENGSIWYGRNRMSKATRYGITRHIRFVSQSDKLIPGTIRDNMEMFVKSVSDEEIWSILEKVDMADIVRKLPYGLDTKINAGSIALSRGQIQRLIIARAIISRPKIMILDEATSALDNICQSKVRETLDEMKCTKIVVAHRLSTVKHCSRILLLDNRTIVEDGSYDELMSRKGRFYELVKLQEIKEAADYQ